MPDDDFSAAFAAALADPARPPPPGVTGRSGPDPTRFAVYRNNVTVGLIGALEARFPVVRLLVGEAFFRDMARIFVADHKPLTPLLMDYGDGLPAFVASFPPVAGLPYLADVARLEIAWSDAYNAAEAPPLAVAALAALPPEDLAETALVAHPAAGLVDSLHPVGSIWAAHQTDPVGTVAAWGPEAVLVVRPEAEVGVHILPVADVAFAAALLDGRPIADAADAAARRHATFDFGGALVGLVSLGAFAVPPAS